MDQPDQDHYQSLGSGQDVKVKKKFQEKANIAYELCLKAIEAGDSDSAHDKWKKVYGRPFPAKAREVEENSDIVKHACRNTEEFIEDKFPVDIRYDLQLECEVSQKGFREHFLTYMLANKIPLLANKKLLFTIKYTNVPKPYTIYWKVLNRGHEAKRRDCIRGQIIKDRGFEKKEERTNFNGNHLVECYAIKDGVVVAKDRINVPIQ